MTVRYVASFSHDVEYVIRKALLLRQTLPVVHDPYANPPTLKPMRHTVSHSITPTFGSSGKAYGSHAQSYGSSTHGAGQSRHGQVTSLQSVSRHRGIASPSNHNSTFVDLIPPH